MPFVLVEAPGEVTPGHDVVSGEALRGAIEEVQRRMKHRISVLHGVNFDVLGRRPAAHYGELDADRARGAGSTASPASSASTWRSSRPTTRASTASSLHRAGEGADGLILNPGAWTHYSWAIRDALEVAGLPAVEVHLSAVDQREEWRRVSVIRDLCLGTVQGKGLDGYREALELLREKVRP